MRALLQQARERARERGQLFCGCEQLLETLLMERGDAWAATAVTDHLDSQPRLGFQPSVVGLSKRLRHMLEQSAATTVDEIVDVLLAERSPIDKELRTRTVERLRQDEVEARPETTMANQAGRRQSSERILRPIEASDRDEYLVERMELTDRLLLTLMFGNPLIVGDVGSGRRSLVRLLARRCRDGAVPTALAETNLFVVEPAAFVAGTNHRGELEARVEQAMQEVLRRPGKSVLVFEDLASLAKAGHASGGVDPLSIILPHVRERRVAILGCVTQDEMRETIEKSPELLSSLTPIYLPRIAPQDATKLLERVPEYIRTTFDVECSEEVVAHAVRLVDHQLPHLALPGAAEKLIQGAAATLSFESSMLERDTNRAGAKYWSVVEQPVEAVGPRLTGRHLLHALSAQHRIPFEHLDSDVGEKIAALDTTFRSHIFGQDQVLPVVRDTVKVGLANLASQSNPRGRLFFLGPPGTGKTETAKLVAQYLMGDPGALLRFDMSAYSTESSVSALRGADPGLVRSEEGGLLTEPLRENPHRVILFDEIEKAHPRVYDIFLPILQEGECQDSLGRRVSFRHSICIFTSNAGFDDPATLKTASRPQILQELRRIFREEFLDRIDSFVPFVELDEAARRKIGAFQLERLSRQLQEVHGLTLDWDAAVLDLVSRVPQGEAGARNILRWVQGVVKPAVVDAVLAAPPKGAILSLRAVGSDGVAVRCEVSSRV